MNWQYMIPVLLAAVGVVWRLSSMIKGQTVAIDRIDRNVENLVNRERESYAVLRNLEFRVDRLEDDTVLVNGESS